MRGLIESARVAENGRDDRQGLLALGEIAEKKVGPAVICQRIGLNWMTARELFQRGWISFDPAAVESATASQQAELVFVGSLVAGGCDDAVLRHMLAELTRPYSYRIDLVYYDWTLRQWQLLPTDADRRGMFDHWVDDLVESAQMDKLEHLRGAVDSAIRELRGWMR